MSKAAKEFRRKFEIWIHVGDELAPLLAGFGLYVPVKRGVNFTAIKISCEELQRVLRFLQARRINDAFPILVRKTRSSNESPMRIRGHRSSLRRWSCHPGTPSFDKAERRTHRSANGGITQIPRFTTVIRMLLLDERVQRSAFSKLEVPLPDSLVAAGHSVRYRSSRSQIRQQTEAECRWNIAANGGLGDLVCVERRAMR